MKNMPCQLPDPVDFPEKLYMHFAGKLGIPIIVVMASWFLVFGHYLRNISQLWTIVILGFFFMYAIIPTKWYMQNVYQFFIGSFIGILCTSLLFYYIGWIFFMESGIYSSMKVIVISAVIVYLTVFLIELYHSGSKISICKVLIKKSIIKKDNEYIFQIGNWINHLKEPSFNEGLGFAMKITLYLSIPIILIGFFGGNPLISARIILNNNQDALVSLVMSIGSIALGIMMMSFAVKELLKIIALIQVED